MNFGARMLIIVMRARPESSVETTGSATALLAVILARVVVPLWLLVGAILKLVDASPTHLPAALIKWFGGLGIDLMFVLQFSIGAELTVVGVMWLLPRLARLAGVVMLGSFLPVLLGDVLMGASSCGCFGAVEVHPGITLALDLSFFLGLLLLGRRVPSLALSDVLPTSRVLMAGVWTVASFAIAFGLTGVFAEVEAAPVNERTGALPSEGYYLPQYEAWIGRPWREVPIAAWVQGAPDDLATGARYILFYRKDCEHCHELMEVFFSGPLTLPTTAVAVPEREGFPTEGVLPVPCSECSTAELPMGIDWFVQTPALVRLNGGVVECAAEVSAADPVCLEW
jgi:hypothetical protein